MYQSFNPTNADLLAVVVSLSKTVVDKDQQLKARFYEASQAVIALDTAKAKHLESLNQERAAVAAIQAEVQCLRENNLRCVSEIRDLERDCLILNESIVRLFDKNSIPYEEYGRHLVVIESLKKSFHLRT